MSASDRYLASGGCDDRVFIYDLKTHKEHCSLTHHNSTITCLKFTPSNCHLISGSSDGVLAMVRVGNWQVEKVWDKAHKGAAILDIAVHSSSALAFTLGADFTLCTWNLVKGTLTFVINLRSKCLNARYLDQLAWNPNDEQLVLYGGKYTEIWDITVGGPVNQKEFKDNVTSCVWKSASILLVGHQNGNITSLDTESNEGYTFKAHNDRIKSIEYHKKQLITASSTGEIKVWNKSFEELVSLDTGYRVTCLCVVPYAPVKAEKNDEDVTVKVVEDTTRKRINKARVVEIIEEDDQCLVEKAPAKKRKSKIKKTV